MDNMENLDNIDNMETNTNTEVFCASGTDPSQTAADSGNLSLEQGMERLEDIISRLERNELTLEEQFALYKEGIGLVKTCNDRIDTVKKKMQILNPDLTLMEME